jgi:hypothetical protein
VTAFYGVQSHTISIELPRVRLSFSVNKDGELESKNMQSLIIDKNQGMGTMIGLNSQLVLCHKDPISADLPHLNRLDETSCISYIKGLKPGNPQFSPIICCQ